MKAGVLTLSGAALAATSWIVLLGPLNPWIAAPPEAVRLASHGLETGLALAIIGVLRTGFSALDRFFVAALERAQKARSVEAQPAHAAAAPQRHITESGWIGDRAYVSWSDGSIDVETLLGVRRFHSLLDAQRFIGGVG